MSMKFADPTPIPDIPGSPPNEPRPNGVWLVSAGAGAEPVCYWEGGGGEEMAFYYLEKGEGINSPLD